MGTWSSSLYGNNTTSDAKDAYTEYLLEQLSNQEALDEETGGRFICPRSTAQ